MAIFRIDEATGERIEIQDRREGFQYKFSKGDYIELTSAEHDRRAAEEQEWIDRRNQPTPLSLEERFNALEPRFEALVLRVAALENDRGRTGT